jgi:beta-phosphoglucomutase family hydrolase
VLGLPDTVTACLFDLDGVLTDTAAVHDAAWKEMFDAFLRERAGQTGEPFVPFDSKADYEAYVDGKPRSDGVRDFLASRGITLPDGTPEDPPAAQTVHGLGNRKNEALLRRIHHDGVRVFEGSRRYLEAARDAGLRRAVVSSSANTVQVLRVVGITGLFDARVDGVVAARRNLPGKPAPDMFIEAAKRLGATPQHCVVIEDSAPGVAAGLAAGMVTVAVLRDGTDPDALAGAHRVVRELTPEAVLSSG